MIGAVTGAVVGLLASPVLRAVAARHSVPYGEPLRVCCPRGRYWLLPNGSCSGCEERGGPTPGLVELAAAGVGAAIGSVAQSPGMQSPVMHSQVTYWPMVLVLAWVGLFGVVLGFVDAAVFRLPDALTLPLALGTAALLVLAELLTEHQGGALLCCLYAGLAFGACYGALALVAPIGFGDAKLAPSLGAVLGWYGWNTALAGFFYGFLLASLWGAALLLTGRSKRGDSLAFGPAMLLGALLAVLAAS
ncbi:A24 family peptidase [Kitasatospora sp. MAP5-34]|uniref:A24 family peptidase n=1 Tax=Kitasatospora sp. MAP5-34 TaxID=3035102 RepID=UPI0024752102|nr:A24 family peptidase [Kitasatospora sp. MAP5-34]MDH6579098.1 leader peptidase (prepilin peptidase)/N-methyltransferase [Kitasatospora sp. MAP5-34]